jgi:hypothetical protein
MTAAITAPSRLPDPTGDIRHRLVVLAPTIGEVVRGAGGWLFDRALAGYSVTALVAGCPDDQPLRILGGTMGELHDDLAEELRAGALDALAVAADLYRHQPRVRQAVLDTMDAGMTNVMMWGETWPHELDGLISSVRHRLSIAARAFKWHAQLAAGTPSVAVERVESFRGLDLRTCHVASKQLVTAS